MARSITVIPARENQVNLIEPTGRRRKRVAAYYRVSTDQLEQLSSYEAQVEYYTNYINSNSEFEMAGIYADEGISGTNTKKREKFNKMIEDCKSGKIDMIITKSISRFARNTLDTLNYVRTLKELGIGVVFEKENIDTLDSKGEVLLTILSSLAQDELRSISENSTWGIRRKFEQGKVIVNHNKFLGYDKDKDGNLIINEEQAKIVRRIYKDFLDGKGANRIARELEEEGVKGWNGKSKWYESTIRKMLANEKYKGDALLQKTYTVDFLTKKKVKNTGQVPQYYVEESHPAIIDKEMWEAVQLETERMQAFSEKHQIQKVEPGLKNSPMSGKIICGRCGRAFGRRVWRGNDERLKKFVWICSQRNISKGVKGSRNKHVYDMTLVSAFVDIFNNMIENKDYFIKKWNEVSNNGNELQKYKAKQFIGILDKAIQIEEFNESLFFIFIEKMTVFEGENIIVTLFDGTEFEVEI